MNAIATWILAIHGLVVAPQQPPRFEQELRATRLSDRLYVLEGGGGNVAVFIWDEGVLLVDDKIAPVSEKVKAAVAGLTPKPIRFVINTHWHPDHRGGNAALAGAGAVIVAHENVRRRMSVDGFVAVFDRKMPASQPEALPVVTFTHDVTLHLGGEEISVTHVDAAHTDGDVFVRFGRANVLHLGDCYLNGSYPVIDYTNGGTYAGTIAAVGKALQLSDDSTQIIPGHGPISNSRELGAWRDMLATILERVRRSAAGGKSLEEIKLERPARDWDGRFPASFVTPDHVVEEAYRAVTGGPQH
ncbi:MAG: MBL fold metallo-hydrolase [Steroidobacteraceae bacterium]